MTTVEQTAASSELSADAYPIYIEDVYYRTPKESILLSFVSNSESGFFNSSASNSDVPTLRWIMSKVDLDSKLVDPEIIARDQRYKDIAFATWADAKYEALQSIGKKFQSSALGKEKIYHAVYVQYLGFDGALYRNAYRIFPKQLEGETEKMVELRNHEEHQINQIAKDICHREAKRFAVEDARFYGNIKAVIAFVMGALISFIIIR